MIWCPTAPRTPHPAPRHVEASAVKGTLALHTCIMLPSPSIVLFYFFLKLCISDMRSNNGCRIIRCLVLLQKSISSRFLIGT